jgi:hypothetical protein
MKAGWTWKGPDGREGLGSTDREAVKKDMQRVWMLVNPGHEHPYQEKILSALGWRIVPVVMVEVPELDEKGPCPPDCFFIKRNPPYLDVCKMGWNFYSDKSDGHIVIHICHPGPDCLAWKVQI